MKIEEVSPGIKVKRKEWKEDEYLIREDKTWMHMRSSAFNGVVYRWCTILTDEYYTDDWEIIDEGEDA